MMRDVDALSRMHDVLIVAHMLLVSKLKSKDAQLRLDACSLSYFEKLLAKGVCSIRKSDQINDVDNTVTNLSHTLNK